MSIVLLPLTTASAEPEPEPITVDLSTIAANAPGCAVGIYRTGRRPVFSNAGYASVTDARPIGPNTRFAVASMSKQFTALAIIKLAERGRLHLDDPTVMWLPEMAGAVGAASIRQLLNQTAGVRDHVTLITLLGVEQLASFDRASSLRLMALQRSTNFAPGSRADYSNGNFLLLSEIVARASRLPFDHFLRQAIFAPLHMNSTAFLPSRGPAAHGYTAGPEGFTVADDLPASSGSGGLFTTTADLARFDADFRLGGRVWSEVAKREMLREARLSDGSDAILPQFGTPYGAGLGLQRDGQELWIQHDGAAEGYRAQYVRLQRAGVSVAVLCNRNDVDPSAMAFAALERAGVRRPLPIVPSSTAGARQPLTATELSHVAGRYHVDELDADMVLSVDGNGLRVEISSPLLPGTNIDHWGGLQMLPDGTLTSGPLRLHPMRTGDRNVGYILDLGRRVQGLIMRRAA